MMRPKVERLADWLEAMREHPLVGDVRQSRADRGGRAGGRQGDEAVVPVGAPARGRGLPAGARARPVHPPARRRPRRHAAAGDHARTTRRDAKHHPRLARRGDAVRGLFVVGTDTGVGKTFVAAAIARAMAREGRSVGVLKPVMTGLSPPDRPFKPSPLAGEGGVGGQSHGGLEDPPTLTLPREGGGDLSSCSWMDDADRLIAAVGGGVPRSVVCPIAYRRTARTPGRGQAVWPSSDGRRPLCRRRCLPGSLARRPRAPR